MPTTKADLRATAPVWVTPADNGGEWRTVPKEHRLHSEELLRRFHRRLCVWPPASTSASLRLRINVWQHDDMGHVRLLVTGVVARRGRRVPTPALGDDDDEKIAQAVRQISNMIHVEADKYDIALTAAGMSNKLQGTKGFGVYNETSTSGDIERHLRCNACSAGQAPWWCGGALPTSVQSLLPGHHRQGRRLRQPTVRISYKLLLLVGPWRNLYDVSMACLRADPEERMSMSGLQSLTPVVAACGDSAERRMGWKTVPKSWQLHFAEVMAVLGARRLRSEPTVYYFPGEDLLATWPMSAKSLSLDCRSPPDHCLVSCRSYSLSSISESYNHPGRTSRVWDVLLPARSGVTHMHKCCN